MINPIQYAIDLLRVYTRTRGAGHTKATLEGGLFQDKVMLLTSEGAKNELRGRTVNTGISVLDPREMCTKLQGYHGPILLDNSVIMDLIQGLLEENNRKIIQIEELREEVKELRTELKQP